MGCTSSSPPNTEVGGVVAGDMDKQQILDVLSHIPLLAKFADEEREKLADVLEHKQFKVGDVVFRQGDPGQGFFIIIKGVASVSRHTDQDSKKEEVGIAELKAGDYFGEAALLNDSRRMATVSVVQPLSCLYLDRATFNKTFSQQRVAVQFAKRAAISAEGDGQNRHHPSLIPINASKDKDPATFNLLLDAVRENVLFRGLSREYKELIIKEMYRLPVKSGIAVIEQGQKGDNFYVVESGLFDVFVKNGEKTRKVATRARGTCFGELALMYNSPRAATVVAVEDSVVWAVDRFTFRKILANVSNSQLASYEEFLKKVDLLAPLSNRERAKICEAIEEVVVQQGQSFIQQGAKGDCMFILREGEVICKKDGAEVARYKAGDYFGERALLKEEVRAATLTCATPTATLLRLDQSAVSLLLGPLEDIMNQRIQGYDESVNKRGSEKELDEKAHTSSIHLPAEPAELPPPKKEDLVTLGLLGKGSFGRVTLVKDPRNNKTFALKAVSKQMIVETGQQGHIMSEKRVMQALRHPFCIRLYATYKDRDRLYLLLEPSLGGELFTILRARVNFDENTARFYAASVISVFEYMHSKNIVYRDLKPENLLLGADGYLKVTDFGFAKVVPERTYTLCGTPDYLAPEIVEGKGHGKGVDWWTLGVLIYEMLASYPPFYDDDPMRTYAKIVQGHVSYPSHFSKAAVNLIGGLLQHKATHRLGVTQGGAERIKQHPWFKGFDWQALVEKRLPAPIIPKVKGTEDISNFDPDRDSADNVPRYVDNGTNWEADF